MIYFVRAFVGFWLGFLAYSLVNANGKDDENK